jgi:hypothetical protein
VENENKSLSVRQIRAVYNERTIRVYQAYRDEIADSALAAGNFVSPPFKMTRMTWIKPSFLWMMYRAGWGFKDEGQARILAIDISREGFEWALRNSCSSHPLSGMSEPDWRQYKEQHPVRIQWDPERDMHSQPLNHRSIQIGLGPIAANQYVSEWIQSITDITPLAAEIHGLIGAQLMEEALRLLPCEREYPLSHELAEIVGILAD